MSATRIMLLTFGAILAAFACMAFATNVVIPAIR